MRALILLTLFWLLPAASHALTLTADEKAWLSARQPLRAGVVLEAPHAQQDSRNQKLSGSSVDLMAALAQALHCTIVWKTYPTQADLDAAARRGEVDLAPGQPQTPAGLRVWLYSTPYLRIPSKVVGLASESQGSLDLESLLSERVAVSRRGAASAFLVANYPALEQLRVDSERAALQQLLAGASEYAVADEAQLNLLLREPEFSRLSVVGDTGYTLLLRLAVRKDEKTLFYLTDRALQTMPDKTLSQLYERWVLPAYPRLTETLSFWRKLSALLALLAAGLVVALSWRRRQQRKLELRLQDTRRDRERQQQTEAELRLTQRSVDLSTVGILWLNWDGRLRYANQAALAMLGYDAATLLGQPFALLDPGLDMDRWLALWNRMRAASMSSFEMELLKANGQTVPVEATFSFLSIRDTEYLVAYLADVTDRRLARTQLRELSAHLETVREEEKARIAREVHDELGQVLTALRLETSMCELSLPGPRETVAARLAAMKKLIEQTFAIVRDVASALRPPILDAGLASAVEWQARRFESRTQISCVAQVSEAPLQLADNTAIGLFRILQEALTNVMRHAEAQTVAITLSLKGEELELSISDDGKGFDAREDRRGKSYGLIGIRERVLMLGGRLTIESEPGQGAVLTVWVPLASRQKLETEERAET